MEARRRHALPGPRFAGYPRTASLSLRGLPWGPGQSKRPGERTTFLFEEQTFKGPGFSSWLLPSPFYPSCEASNLRSAEPSILCGCLHLFVACSDLD